MSTKLSAGRVRSTYEFIKANRGNYSVQARGCARRSFGASSRIRKARSTCRLTTPDRQPTRAVAIKRSLSADPLARAQPRWPAGRLQAG
jgi:hypothetical protein